MADVRHRRPVEKIHRFIDKMRVFKKRTIVLVNEETGEKLHFDSINGAARFARSTFAHIQRAAIYNGVANGWRVYEGPETIREHIEELKRQLEIVEK